MMCCLTCDYIPKDKLDLLAHSRKFDHTIRIDRYN